MAHELTPTATGVEYAFRGSHGLPWHGLGTSMPADADLDRWVQEAGMGWDVKAAPLQYTPAGFAEPVALEDRFALYRSDSGAPLGVASDVYRPVHPHQMLELFRGVLEEGHLEMSSAGTLQGGKKFFATAKVGSAEVGTGDRIDQFLLIASSADGGSATTVRRTTTRVVCSNTLRVASRGAADLVVRHRTELDLTAARAFMGLNTCVFNKFMSHMRALANRDMRVDEAEWLTAQLLAPAGADLTRPSVEEAVRKSVGFKKVLRLFDGSAVGANLDGATGTAYGLLQSVTEFVDHHARAQSPGNRLNAALFGAGAELKERAFLRLMEVAA